MRRFEPHRTIHRTCAAKGVPFLTATEALEAWFLSDLGITRWLDLPTPKGMTDGIADPKSRISNAFFKKTGRRYQKRSNRPKVALHANGTGTRHNASFRAAIAKLTGCVTLPSGALS